MTKDREDNDFEEICERFSDYYEGTLSSADREMVESRITADERCGAAYAQFEQTMQLLSSLPKAPVPGGFDRQVEETIHRRSGGRFFGKRAWGDRIPYELIAIVVMLLVAGLFWLGRSSGTGGHKLNDNHVPDIHENAQEVIPRM